MSLEAYEEEGFVKSARAFVCLLLAFCLVAVLPGAECYAAAGRIVSGGGSLSQGSGAGGSSQGRSTAHPNSAAPVKIEGLPPVFPVHAAGIVAAPGPAPAKDSRSPELNPSAPEKLGGALVENPVSLAAKSVKAAQEGIPASSGKPAFTGVSREMPDFGRMGDQAMKAALGQDFAERLGGSEIEAGPSEVPVSPAGADPSRQGLRLSLGKGDAAGGAKERTPGSLKETPSGVKGRGGNWAIFGLIGMLGLGAASESFWAAAAHRAGMALLVIPITIFSLIVHEMGHAKAAYKLGDPTAVLQNRLSWKWKDLRSHMDLWFTVVIPAAAFIALGAIIGTDKVNIKPSNFKNPVRDRVIAALAGPAVNVGLALLGALAYAGLGVLGIGGVLAAAAAIFTFVNAGLAMFNLLPFYPLDGHNLVRGLIHWLAGLMPRGWADKLIGFNAKLDEFYETGGIWAWMPFIAFVSVAAVFGLALAAVSGATSLLLGGAAVVNLQLAGAFLPAVAALGLMAGQMKDAGPPRLNPGRPIPVEAVSGDKPIELIVYLEGATKPLSEDLHLSWVDLSAPNAVAKYARTQQSMLAQLEEAGLSAQTLASYNATPVATYQRINTTTLRVDAAKAEEFKAMLLARGHQVRPNGKRRIIEPVPANPENADPGLRNPVTIDENLKIMRADKLQEIARNRWGPPENELGLIGRLVLRVVKAVIPQPPVSAIDTGINQGHKMLKGINPPKNATAAENKDDIGHGSWVTGMIRAGAPWLKNLTHYKAFVNGEASDDDILKAMTMSANDGNILISNSWGSDEGDPDSPDSRMARKLAEEGIVVVFAAGNNGMAGPNSIGNPAIVYYKDSKTGAIRVIAVAAADRNKKIVYFSSKGPRSQKTKDDPNYPARPDISAIGYNVEGAWHDPQSADRDDPVYGILKALSGTSMAAPAIVMVLTILCMLFGVTAKGEKLDAVVNAVLANVEKTGQGHDAEGEGFVNAEAAYEALKQAMRPAVPNFLARAVLGVMRRLG